MFRKYRQSVPPAFLSPSEVEQVLAATGSTLSGRRDHAILLLLARLGLRGSEVVALELADAAAMALLHRGVDLSVIALWLGHESTESTQIYLHADMQLKERALAHATSSGLAPDRFRPPGPLLAFLESL
jgi:site-specific recombinase XerD